MVQTSRWGFNKFGGSLGGSISDDDGKFSSTDRDLQDRLFAFFENHVHDGGSAPVALATPANAPGSSLSNTGGTIARGGTRYYRYTVVDQFGFESAGSPEVAVVLPDSIHITVAPVVVGGNAGGSALAQGTYYYALTGNTADGETIIGPEAVITIQAGQNQAVLTLPALPSGVTSWNLWRMGVTEDGWTKVGATQPAGTFTDIGYASGACLCDPTTQPPTLDLGPGGTISITITPVSGDLTGAISWRLYETDTSGVYANASLVAAVVPTVVGDPPPASYIDTGTALIIGQPPTTSTTITPSHEVVGGSGGGGGADSHWNSDTADQTLPVTTGDLLPVYVEGAGLDVVGHDIVVVYEPSGDSEGDELQFDTSAVYSLFGRIFVDAVTPGDQFLVNMNWDAGGPSNSAFLPAVLGMLVVPPGATQAAGSWMLPPIYIPEGSRVSFQLQSLFSATAPDEIQVSIGAQMASGSPALAEVYPAPAAFAAAVSGAGDITANWTLDVTDTDYHVLVYDRGSIGAPVAKHVVTGLGTIDLGTFAVGRSYDIVGLAHKTIDTVDMFSTAAIASASLNPSSGFLFDGFDRADSDLGLPDWITGLGDPAGVMQVEGNALANSGTGGMAYAVHNLANYAKWVNFTHTAPASGAPVGFVLASGFTLGNPRVLLTVDPTGGTAPTIDYYDGSGTHTAVVMTAENGGLTAYAGSSATLRATIHGDQVMLYQAGTLVAIGIIPAPVTLLCGGVGLHPTGSNGGTVDDFTIVQYRSVASGGPGGSQRFSAGGVTYAAELLPVDDATAGRIAIVALYGKQSAPTLDGFTQIFERHDGTGYLSLWHKTLAGTEGGGLQVYAQAAPFVGVLKTYDSSFTTVAGSGAASDTCPTASVAIGDAIFYVVASVSATANNVSGTFDSNIGGENDVPSTDSFLLLMCGDEDSAIAGTSEARTMPSDGTSPTYSSATVVISP